MKIKNIELGNWNLNKDVRPFQPNKNIEIKWWQDKEARKQNNTFASVIGDTKAEINGQLSKLSKNIVSERVRTLNNLPKWRIVNTTKKRIY